MPAFNYKKQFAELVATGRKRQTIRAMRKRPIKVGDKLYHFAGMRTKQCRRLLPEPTICVSAWTIWVYKHSAVYVKYGDNRRIRLRPLLGHNAMWGLPAALIDAIAAMDGFDSSQALIDFLKKEHGLPFKGQVIRW